MKWVTSSASLFTNPGGPQRACRIEPGKLVEPTCQVTSASCAGVNTPVNWEEVKYEDSEGHCFQGWVYSGFLEDFNSEFPLGVVAAATQTRTPNDAAQDIVWLDKVQYNLCGEFCVAFLAGDSIDGMLTKWKPKSPTLFNKIFRVLVAGKFANLSRPTGRSEVQDMLAVYNKVGVEFDKLLQDPVKGDTIVTPGRFATVTSAYDIILGVNIDAVTGDIRGQGIGHWICVTEVKPDGRNRGWVTFYNPFPNQMQRESWGTLVGSMHEPYGLAIKRGQ